MKIAHLVSTFPPYAGGIGNAALAEAKQLAERGHQIAVFTPRSKSYFLDQHINIRYLRPWLKYGNAAFVPQVVFLLKDFDLIYLHWPFIGAEKILLAKLIGLLKQPLVVRYHMDLIDRGIRGLLFSAYSSFCLPWLVKAADKIVVSSLDYARSSRLKNYLKQQEDKFVVVPFGVGERIFFPQPPDEEFRKKYYLLPEDKVILFVGGLDRAHYFKGVSVLLDAFRKLVVEDALSSVKLLIVGRGELLEQYREKARKLGISDRMIFAGIVKQGQLNAYYNLAYLFVLPSTTRSEAFGLVSLEAMSCGVPIVVSDLPGVRTLAEQTCLVARPNDADDLAEKMNKLLTNQQLARELGERGRKKTLEHYSWPAVAEQLEQIYERL